MNLGILGSTGSIGKQALTVVDGLSDVNIVSLSAAENIELLEQQIRKYHPKIAAVKNEKKAEQLRIQITDTDTKVVAGDMGVCEAATFFKTDMLLTSVVGIAGLKPTYMAIQAGIPIALANKETMVTAGKIIMDLAHKNKVPILPVDSEHSAIFQCLNSVKDKKEISKLIITASGGPFLGKTRKDLKNVTVDQALNHPNWEMGKKITIDSATMMNKGFELMEAKWLFDIEVDRIDVVVHKESIIHSMVQFVDNAVLAQMSYPDMRLPIQYALTYPHRERLKTQELDFTKIAAFSFEKPDEETFECLKLAKQAVFEGGSMPVVLNAANEIAVGLFLDKLISFLEISQLVRESMQNHKKVINPTIEEILNIDKQTREITLKLAGL